MYRQLKSARRRGSEASVYCQCDVSTGGDGAGWISEIRSKDIELKSIESRQIRPVTRHGDIPPILEGPTEDLDQVPQILGRDQTAGTYRDVASIGLVCRENTGKKSGIPSQSHRPARCESDVSSAGQAAAVRDEEKSDPVSLEIATGIDHQIQAVGNPAV